MRYLILVVSTSASSVSETKTKQKQLGGDRLRITQTGVTSSLLVFLIFFRGKTLLA